MAEYGAYFAYTGTVDSQLDVESWVCYREAGLGCGVAIPTLRNTDTGGWLAVGTAVGNGDPHLTVRGHARIHAWHACRTRMQRDTERHVAASADSSVGNQQVGLNAGRHIRRRAQAV